MRRILLILLVVLVAGLCIPQQLHMPVQGADTNSFHPRSFWFHPWGASGTHKGVDIFAKKGTAVNAATAGWILYTGSLSRGGNVVLVLGPKWRVHYYAHLDTIHVSRFAWVCGGERIGAVGATGNAHGKPPHLHYSIATLLPYPWRVDGDPQGWKKMFYLDPTRYFTP
ncbi:MAG: M23 family metallopeptidase [Flavobacteriales bacterium]|nr:M23 family metallopeptidase [Flavobacteriales bacterium]